MALFCEVTAAQENQILMALLNQAEEELASLDLQLEEEWAHCQCSLSYLEDFISQFNLDSRLCKEETHYNDIQRILQEALLSRQ
jgi:hypothetical protein